MATKKAANKAPAKKAAPPAPPVPPRDNAELLGDTPLTMHMEVGRAQMDLDDALRLDHQSILHLDKTVRDPVDVFLNGRLFARGEVVTVKESYGVRLIEIVEPV
jgi:flagellar motor switch protein FliN/FliY